jgi:hypothetical protein
MPHRIFVQMNPLRVDSTDLKQRLEATDQNLRDERQQREESDILRVHELETNGAPSRMDSISVHDLVQ